MNADELRAGYVVALTAEATRRFGAARAEALARTIADVALWMTDVATFPVDADEPPAFYAEPAP
ncbi:MAG TPA: hypothetical protein VGJ70_04000 [Solirubrobacteraceae bacterium]